MSEQAPPRLATNIYRSLLWLLTPYLYWRFYREGKQYQDEHYLPQRCGRRLPDFDQPPIWFHAASVGEFNALLPLIQAVQATSPSSSLLLTTNTPSSGALARKKLPAGVQHAYLPVDWPQATQQFLASCQPRLGIIMETEIWPNLFRQCDKGATPLVIINGRVSTKTLKAPRWLCQLYRDSLQRTASILARSNEDKENFINLGADASQCQVIGNIKFAGVTADAAKAIELGRPYTLAASTRDEEEKLILEAWQQSGRKELLVIAPRHPQRLKAILQDIASYHLNIAIRSRGEAPTADTQLYLADTFGELRGFMQGAEMVFMGGSLVAKGGQNILEPAALGKAVITGPHMDNFIDETRTLLSAKGLLQVNSIEQLSEAFITLLEDRAAAQQYGEAARACVQQQGNIVEHYLSALKPYL